MVSIPLAWRSTATTSTPMPWATPGLPSGSMKPSAPSHFVARIWDRQPSASADCQAPAASRPEGPRGALDPPGQGGEPQLRWRRASRDENTRIGLGRQDPAREWCNRSRYLLAAVFPWPACWDRVRGAVDSARSPELNRAEREGHAAGYYEGLIGGNDGIARRSGARMHRANRPAG